MDKSIFLLLTIFLALSSGEIVYIKPTNDTQCIGEPCYTFSEYITSLNPVIEPLHSTPYVKHVAIINYPLEIVFMEGIHSLDLVGPLYLKSEGTEKYGVNFTGIRSSSSPGKFSIPEIECNDITGLRISGRAYAVFSNLAIVHCGVPNDWDIELQLVSSRSAAALVFHQIVQLVLVNVSISQSLGYGLLSLDSENMTIRSCTFIGNSGSDTFHGGNILISLSDSENSNTTSLMIESTLIKDGYSFLNEQYSSGLCIQLSPHLRDYVVQIHNTVLLNNSALGSYGGNFLILVTYFCSSEHNTTLSVLPVVLIVLERCTVQHGEGWTGGGAVRVRESLTSSNFCGQFRFVVSSTFFMENRATASFGGLQIALKDHRINYDVVLQDSVFESNVGYLGAIEIDTIVYNHVSKPKYIKLEIRNCTIVDNTGGAGLGIQLSYSYIYGASPDSYCMIGTSYVSEIKVKDCFISQNNCGDFASLVFQFFSNYVTDSQKLIVENCTFSHNSIDSTGLGAAVSIHGNRKGKLSVIFDSVSFSYSNSGGNISNTPSTVYLKNLENVLFSNCIFNDNDMRGLSAYRSSIYFQGLVTFSNNTGINGGAILLCGDSTLRPHLNSTVMFISNHALHTGGAISCEQKCWDYAYNVDCFVQPEVQYLQLSTIKFVFVANTATFAGSALFGGSMNTCFWRENVKGTEMLDNIVRFENASASELSSISSDPIGICFCLQDQNLPNCTKKSQNTSIFPGTTSVVSIVTVGQYDGVVPGVAVASPSSVLDDLQDYQGTRNICTKVQYTIFSSSSVTLTLSAKQPESLDDAKYIPPQINI